MRNTLATVPVIHMHFESSTNCSINKGMYLHFKLSTFTLLLTNYTIYPFITINSQTTKKKLQF